MEPVSRFCPECGQRARATIDKFSEPQVCPKCKTRVMFFELPTELPLIEDDGKPVEPESLRKFDSRIAISALIGLAVASLFLMIGVLTGISFIVIAAAAVAFAAGLVGVAVVMDHRSKVNKLASAYSECRDSLNAATKGNRTIVARYYAMKTNYDTIVAEAIAAAERETAEAISAKDKAEESIRLAEETANRRIQESERKVTEKANQISRDAISKSEQVQARADSIVSTVIYRFLADTKKNLQSKLTVNNYGASRDRFLKAVEFCEKQGAEVNPDEVDKFILELKSDFEQLVKIQANKEEQARIKERIREEERARLEIERELKRVATEREAIERAIAEVMAKTQDEHSAEMEMLKAKLAEAEERSKRALSMAQQTKAGNVYVISNIGSFGESVFKIGMTRRLEPMDRVKELGDASVPFPFDVHMMIFSDDAPAMEAALHRKFNHERVNRVNLRKEFFRVQLDEIVTAVEQLAGRVEYIADPEALEYRESQRMTDEDVDMIFSTAGAELLDDDDN